MNSTTEDTMLTALLKLLDDPDPEVFSQIENKVVEIGPTALPYLKNAAKKNTDQLSDHRIQTLLSKIQFNKTMQALRDWKNNADAKLIDAAVILSEYQYPELSRSDLYQQLEKLKKDVWLELNDDFTPLEKIHILNHVFFKIYHYRGNKTLISVPQNSLLKDLLEKRQGNSVILSILYMEIAQSLELPVLGVDLPENYILAYINSNELLSDSRVMFYINPFNNGIVFTKEDIDTFIKQLDLEPREQYFAPSTPLNTLKRLMKELIDSYELSGDLTRSNDLKMMISSLTN